MLLVSVFLDEYCFASTVTSLAIHGSHGLRGGCTSAEYFALQPAVCFHCNGSGSMHIAEDIYYSDFKLFWGRPTLCYSTSSLSTFLLVSVLLRFDVTRMPRVFPI